MSASAIERFNKTHGDALKFIPKTTNFESHSYRAHRCRFAIVYGVGAMDSYFTKKFTDKLTDFLKARGVTKDLEHRLQKAGIDTNFFLTMLREEDFSIKKRTRPFSKIHSRIRQSLGKYTSQSTEKIDELFRAYEIDDLSQNAIRKSKKLGLLRDLRKPEIRLEKIILRRHQIVHANDFNMRGAYTIIDAINTKKELEIIRDFVLGANEIIDCRFKKL